MNSNMAVFFIVLSSVAGSVVDPIGTGFIQNCIPWQWIFLIQLILGAAVQSLHLFLIPETTRTAKEDAGQHKEIYRTQRNEGRALATSERDLGHLSPIIRNALLRANRIVSFPLWTQRCLFSHF